MGEGVVRSLKGKVSPDVAQKEITKWLDHKRISEKKRETYEDQIETLTDAIADGFLSVNDKHELVHKLIFPLEGDLPLSELIYTPRLKVSTVQTHLNGVKTSDADGRVCAYIAALSSKPKAVIKGLDTEDYSISQAVAVFFL